MTECPAGAILSDLGFDIASDSTANHSETTMRIVLRDNAFASHDAQANDSDTIDRKAKRSRSESTEKDEEYTCVAIREGVK